MNAPAISDLVPWREFILPRSPWENTWAFNPSIVRIPDDADHPHAGAWLCNLRCANYHLPGSAVQENSTHSQNGVARRIRNRNWMLVLDPATWRAVDAVEVCDRSEYASSRNAASGHVLGYEDLRLAYSDSDGLIASATTMICNSDGVLEIAVLDLDDEYQIESVQPLRGSWSGRHQKNWMPILPGSGANGEHVRWLYSPEDGGVHDRSGRMIREHRRVPVPQKTSMIAPDHVRAHATSFQHGAIGVSLLPSRQRVAPPRQTPLDLRGGTQLIPAPEAGPDRWLGLVHGCRVSTRKDYWHHAVLVGPAGDLLAISPAMKLSSDHGIEFAAGLARDPSGDGDRLVVTYGIEDDYACLAVTSARRLLATLEPIA